HNYYLRQPQETMQSRHRLWALGFRLWFGCTAWQHWFALVWLHHFGCIGCLGCLGCIGCTAGWLRGQGEITSFPPQLLSGPRRLLPLPTSLITFVRPQPSPV